MILAVALFLLLLDFFTVDDIAKKGCNKGYWPHRLLLLQSCVPPQDTFLCVFGLISLKSF